MREKDTRNETRARRLAFDTTIFVYLIFSVVLLFSLVLLEATVISSSLQTIAWIVMIVGALGLFVLPRLYPEGPWSGITLFYLIALLFHAGLFIYPAFTGELPPREWFLDPVARRAGYLLSIGLVAYIIGCLLAALWNRQGRLQEPPVIPDQTKENALKRSVAIVGGITVVISVSAWFVMSVSAAGPLFFWGSYLDYLAKTAELRLGLTYMGISLGMTMLAQNVKGYAARGGIAAFIFFAVMGLPIGLRGEVLIPFTAAVVVFARSHRMPKTRFFVLGIIGILTLIAIVKRVRQSGLLGMSEVSEDDFSGSPLAAIEEMGASIRVLFVSIRWHEISAEPFANGITYRTPFVRFVHGLLGFDRIPSDQDYGLMNVEVADRVGQIGGSIFGEAHHNFGIIGIIAILFITGFILSKLQAIIPTPGSMALVGVCLVLALMHVRNSFAPIFAWLVVGIILIVAAQMLSHILRRVSGDTRMIRSGF